VVPFFLKIWFLLVVVTSFCFIISHRLYIYFIFLISYQGMELSKIIYEKGCVQAGEEWMEHNLIIISATVIVVMFFQVSV